MVMFSILPVILSSETNQEVFHRWSLYISMIPEEVKIPAASAANPAAIKVSKIVDMVKTYLLAYLISPR